MAFPTSPTNGQTTTVNNILYRYNLSANRWERVLTSVNTLVSSDGATTANLTLSNTGTLILTSPLGYYDHTFANDAYGNLIIDNAIGLKADVGAIQVGGTGGQFPTLYSNGVLESAQYGSISLSSIQEFSLDSFNSVQVDQNGVTIGTNLLDTSKYWSFGLDGNLTVPGSITGPGGQGGNTVIQAPMYNQVVIENNAGYNVVTVQDQDVRIVTSPDYGTTFNTWAFGTAGTTTFPKDTIKSISTLSISILGSSGIPISLANFNGQGGWNQGYYSNLATTGGSGHGLTVDVAAGGGGYISINQISIHTPGSGYTDGDVITITNEYNLSSTFTIGVAANTWNFGTDGTLTLPSGPKIYAGYPGTGFISDVATLAGDQVYLSTTNGLGWMGIDGGIPRIGWDSTNKYWNFGTDGLLTFPDGTTNSGATVIALGVYDIQSIGNTLIQTSAAQGAQTWTFATNGSLTFPDSTIQTTAYPGTKIGNAINIGTTSSNIFIPNTNTQALGLINSLAGVYIEAGTPQKVWQFNTNGTLTFPDATVQTTAYLGTATNIANGGTGGIPYQSAPGITKFINIGANTTVLQSNGTTATWVTTASLSVGLATTATSLGSGIINISNKTSSTSTTTGALQVVGGVGIGGAVYIGQTSYINNSQILTSSTFGQFITSGVSSVNAGTDTAINTSTGAVTIWNTSTLQSITNRGNSTTNVVLIANTSSSTSTNTGALVVSGGVGISGGVYVGGTITATNITVRSATGALFVGDFDNLTVNNRTNFITNTVNSSTGIYAIPNGTSGAASWQAANNSNLTNASKILIATNGSTDVQLVSGINGSGTYLPLSFYNGGVQQMVLSTTGTLTINTGSLIITTGTIYGLASPGTTSTSGASQVGYLGMPQQSKSSAYTTVISDAGKHIYVTATATITIDSNANVAYPIGTTIAFIAAAGATVTIAITSDTMYLGGTGTTGSRTLAAYGMATAVKVTSTSWFINGTGLT